MSRVSLAPLFIALCFVPTASALGQGEYFPPAVLASTEPGAVAQADTVLVPVQYVQQVVDQWNRAQQFASHQYASHQTQPIQTQESTPAPPAEAITTPEEEDNLADCGCESCNYCCPPLWEARMTYFSLIRDLSDAPIVTNGGATQLSAAQFDTGYEPGVEFSLRGPVEEFDFQVRYIHSDSFNTATNYTGVAGDMIWGLALGAGVQRFSYESSFNSLELNFLPSTAQTNFELFFGLAYIQYEETFNFGVNFNGTENDLFGLQLGANALLYESDQFSLEATGRAGAYYARTKSEFFVGGAGGNAFARDNTAAFVGEVGLLAAYEIACNFSIEASYHALWMSGGALAGEQVGSSFIGPPFTTQLNHGDIFFHGFNLGVAKRW